MTEVQRRIAITRKVSLADYADGWDDCYAIVTLADFHEKSETQSIKDKITAMTDIEATKFMLDVDMKHFVSGKIQVLDAADTPELVAMKAEDIATSERIISDLYLTIMGVTLDPKATQTTTDTSPTPDPTNEPLPAENSTKTS